MGVPTAEQPPEGLNAYWLGVWRHCLKVLKEQKTWAWEQKPLVDEYVFALIAAEEARGADEQVKWDRHVARASLLADQLALTPRGRKAVPRATDGDGEQDPFAELDELSPRRAARGAQAS